MKLSKDNEKIINETLKNGGIIAYVTDTVWGVGCLPNNKKGVEKIYELKHRDTSKPLILMSDSVKNLLPYVQNVSDKANDYIEKFFAERNFSVRRIKNEETELIKSDCAIIVTSCSSRKEINDNKKQILRCYV